MGIKKLKDSKNVEKLKKMKIGFFFAAVSATRLPRETQDEKTIEGEKRYAQMVDMMRHFNADFDERKYWAYGCNCFMVGDRPCRQWVSDGQLILSIKSARSGKTVKNVPETSLGKCALENS